MSDFTFPSNTTTTTTADGGVHYLLQIAVSDNGYVVSEPKTDTYGHGPSLLEAFADFWSALRDTEAVLAKSKVTPRLERELFHIRRLLAITP